MSDRIDHPNCVGHASDWREIETRQLANYTERVDKCAVCGDHRARGAVPDARPRRMFRHRYGSRRDATERLVDAMARGKPVTARMLEGLR